MVDVNTNYELYYQNELKWIFYYSSHDLDVIYDLMKQLSSEEENIHFRVNANKKVLSFVKGTEHQLNWFKRKYIDKDKHNMLKYEDFTDYDNYIDDDNESKTYRKSMYI